MMDSGSEGRFYIIGYGYVPRECQKKGAECDITICGRNTLDIVSPNIYDFWRFSITGDIGQLVYNLENPNSDQQQIAGFSTNDVIQSFQLVASPSTPPPVPTPAPVAPATEAPTPIVPTPSAPTYAPTPAAEDILLLSSVAIDVLGSCASTNTCTEDGRSGALEWFTDSTNHPDNYIEPSKINWLVR